jgi:hypothetical protein
MSSLQVFSGVCVAQSIIFCVVFCGPMQTVKHKNSLLKNIHIEDNLEDISSKTHDFR